MRKNIREKCEKIDKKIFFLHINNKEQKKNTTGGKCWLYAGLVYEKRR